MAAQISNEKSYTKMNALFNMIVLKGRKVQASWTANTGHMTLWSYKEFAADTQWYSREKHAHCTRTVASLLADNPWSVTELRDRKTGDVYTYVYEGITEEEFEALEF